MNAFLQKLLWFFCGCLLANSMSASLALCQTNQNTLPSSQSGSRPAADRNKYAVIISGASGEAGYAKQFAQWTSSLRAALVGRFGFADEHVRLLIETPTDATAAPAKAEEVKRVFGSLRTELKSENVLFIFLIGHGAFDGKEAKFNLIGPDLSAGEYNNLLSSLPTRRVIVFDMTSASGEFVKPLAAAGRIIITATHSGQEQNATRFTEFLITALGATDADADQDGRFSVLEAFTYANRLTANFYTRAGRLATEHALLEDNGDGVGHQKAEAGDGLLARATYIDSRSQEEAAANVAIARLRIERTRLEGEIAQLIARKKDLPEPEYENALEKLFIELAKTNRALKQGALSPGTE
jgi:hypothetical protein